MKCNVCGAEMSCVILDWYCPREDDHDQYQLDRGKGSATWLRSIGEGMWVWRADGVSLTISTTSNQMLDVVVDHTCHDGGTARLGPTLAMNDVEISGWLVWVKSHHPGNESIQRLPDKVWLT